jgi:hypothetical protein
MLYDLREHMPPISHLRRARIRQRKGRLRSAPGWMASWRRERQADEVPTTAVNIETSLKCLGQALREALIEEGIPVDAVCFTKELDWTVTVKLIGLEGQPSRTFQAVVEKWPWDSPREFSRRLVEKCKAAYAALTRQS